MAKQFNELTGAFTPKLAKQVLSKQTQTDNAAVVIGNSERPFRVQEFTFALDTAQLATSPFKIRFPFKSIVVRSASDSNTSVNIRLGSQDTIQSPIALFQNDSLNFDFPINEAYLDWTSQPSKTMTLLFLVEGRVRLGSLIAAISGGVTQQDGTAVAAIASVTLAAATAAAIAPSLSTRKTCTIQNNTGAILYVGGSNTVTADATATGGIQVPANGQLIWRNTAELWGISTAGGIVNRLEES